MSDTISKAKLLERLEQKRQEYAEEYEVYREGAICDVIEEIQSGRFNTDGWISVKDKLPPNMEMVLISTSQGVKTGYYADGGWRYLSSWTHAQKMPDFMVAHWMSLPPPPEVTDQ